MDLNVLKAALCNIILSPFQQHSFLFEHYTKGMFHSTYIREPLHHQSLLSPARNTLHESSKQ